MDLEKASKIKPMKKVKGIFETPKANQIQPFTHKYKHIMGNQELDALIDLVEELEQLDQQVELESLKNGFYQ